MRSGTVRIDRAQRAIRLIGEARELGVGTEAARRHLVESLARELGASLAGAVDDRAYRVGATHGCARVTLAGFDPQTFGVYYAHHEHGSAVNPLHHAIIQLRARGLAPDVTTRSDEIVPRRTWDRSPWVAEIARPAGVQHFLCSVRFVGPDAVRGFGFMRAMRDRPFSDEDRAILHLVASEQTHLFADELRASPRLSPRLRDTLRWLLTGAPDKEIAAQLRLSPHTVHQYVKALLRAHGATSRAQLIARHPR